MVELDFWRPTFVRLSTVVTLRFWRILSIGHRKRGASIFDSRIYFGPIFCFAECWAQTLPVFDMNGVLLHFCAII